MRSRILRNVASRDLIHDISPNLDDAILNNSSSFAAYIGIDLTANSLHIGNLASLILAKRFLDSGHRVFILLGGASTMIGDPSFKNCERELISLEILLKRKSLIKSQIEEIFKSYLNDSRFKILDNLDWYKSMSLLDFLKDTGKHITINYMQAKESVKQRMISGISFTEFTYQLIQAYDFYHLNQNFGVELQLGGSDQWGNITTGIELVRKKTKKSVYGLTTHLVTRSDGTKLGKSESGKNLWLSKELTSPYNFFQFWINIPDNDCVKFFKIFTDIEINEINDLLSEHMISPEKRIMQRRLAKEITDFVHPGNDILESDAKMYDVFSKKIDFSSLDKDNLLRICRNLPKLQLKIGLHSEIKFTDIVDFLIKEEVFESKGDLYRTISAGGLYINRNKIYDKNFYLSKFLLFDKYLILQRGKKKYYFIIFLESTR